MGTADLLHHLRSAGLVLRLEPGGGLRVSPSSALTDDHRAAIRADRDGLVLALVAERDGLEPASEARNLPAPHAPAHVCPHPPMVAGAQAPDPAPTPRRRSCSGCAHFGPRRTCFEPAAAGLDPPPGHSPGAPWFGIRWPPAGYGATCAAYTPRPAPAQREGGINDRTHYL